MSAYSRFYEAPYSAIRVGLKPQTVYPEDIQCVHDPNENNVGGIYISNLEAAQNPKTLNRHAIKAVITAASGATLNHSRSDVPHYKYIPGEDHERFDLARYFEEAVKFIEQHSPKTNVLVHCMAGISRSVSLVIAYLIKSRGMDYHSAFNLVKARRKIIHPNDGFIQQLKNYEKEIRGRRASQSPEKRYDEPTRRYQTPQTRRHPPSASSHSTLKSNILAESRNGSDHPRNASYSTLKKSTILNRDYSYNNEEELDQKIEEIRKKYADLSNTMSPARRYQNTTIDLPSNDSYRYRSRYAHSYYDKDERAKHLRFEHYRPPLLSTGQTDRPFERVPGGLTGMDTLRQSHRLRPETAIGLPLRKFYSNDIESTRMGVF